MGITTLLKFSKNDFFHYASDVSSEFKDCKVAERKDKIVKAAPKSLQKPTRVFQNS